MGSYRFFKQWLESCKFLINDFGILVIFVYLFAILSYPSWKLTHFPRRGHWLCCNWEHLIVYKTSIQNPAGQYTIQKQMATIYTKHTSSAAMYWGYSPQCGPKHEDRGQVKAPRLSIERTSMASLCHSQYENSGIFIKQSGLAGADNCWRGHGTIENPKATMQFTSIRWNLKAPSWYIVGIEMRVQM